MSIETFSKASGIPGIPRNVPIKIFLPMLKKYINLTDPLIYLGSRHDQLRPIGGKKRY